MIYSYPHLLRIFQLIRLLSRDSKIMQLVISKAGVQIIFDKINQLIPKIFETGNSEDKPYTSLLIEIISIAKRMYMYLEEQDDCSNPDSSKADAIIDTTNNEDQQLILEQLVTPLQALLK